MPIGSSSNPSSVTMGASKSRSRRTPGRMRTTRRTLPTTVAKPEPVVTVDPVARVAQAVAAALVARVDPAGPEARGEPVGLAVREALAVVAALVELVEPVAPVAAEDPAALAVRAVPVALEGRRATARSSVAARSAMPTPSTAAAA